MPHHASARSGTAAPRFGRFAVGGLRPVSLGSGAPGAQVQRRSHHLRDSDRVGALLLWYVKECVRPAGPASRTSCIFCAVHLRTLHESLVRTLHIACLCIVRRLPSCKRSGGSRPCLHSCAQACPWCVSSSALSRDINKASLAQNRR